MGCHDRWAQNPCLLGSTAFIDALTLDLGTKETTEENKTKGNVYF